MIPDGERLISDALRESPSLTALEAKVVGRTPQDTRLPWVRISQIDATGGYPDRLVRFMFQADCYAGDEDSDAAGQPGAALLARSVRARIAEISEEGHTSAHGVISGATVAGGGRVPDQDFTPARERFIYTITVWAHE